MPAVLKDLHCLRVGECHFTPHSAMLKLYTSDCKWFSRLQTQQGLITFMGNDQVVGEPGTTIHILFGSFFKRWVIGVYFDPGIPTATLTARLTVSYRCLVCVFCLRICVLCLRIDVLCLGIDVLCLSIVVLWLRIDVLGLSIGVLCLSTDVLCLSLDGFFVSIWMFVSLCRWFVSQYRCFVS